MSLQWEGNNVAGWDSANSSSIQAAVCCKLPFGGKPSWEHLFLELSQFAAQTGEGNCFPN